MKAVRERPGGRILLALLSGALLAFSFPGASIGILAFVALTPLTVALVAARSKLEAFMLATAGVMLSWLITLPWVIPVMSKYGGLPLATGIAIYVALAFVLGLYGGLFGLLVRLARPDERFLSWVAVPAAWVTIEFARTHLLSGFPWHLIGGALIDLRWLVQPAAWIGPYGLGFLVVSVSTAIAWHFTWGSRATSKRTFAALAGVIVLWCAAGFVQVMRHERRARGEAKARAVMIQPDVTQEMRWDYDQIFEIFERVSRLTDEALAARPEVVVWPESTIPLVYLDTPFWREFVEQASVRAGVDIILGSVAKDEKDETKLWNAAYLVHNGSTGGRYDKIRLVPFGEYVPLRKLLFFAEKLVRAVGEFQFGTNDRPLTGRFRYGPAICYEIVYPGVTRRQVGNGAEVLVTITNDGWFGDTAAPHQHLNMARMRAVESDRYLLRAATTGISALVDPTGRIVRKLGMNQMGVVSGEFAPRQSRTPYVRFGDWAAIVAILWVACAIALRMKRDRSRVARE